MHKMFGQWLSKGVMSVVLGASLMRVVTDCPSREKVCDEIFFFNPH